MVNKEYLEYLRESGRYDDFVSHLYGLGWLPSDIAKELDTSRQNIHNAIDRHVEMLESQAEQMLYLSKNKPGFQKKTDE